MTEPTLSDEEIDKLWRDTPAQGDPTGKLFYRYFARAIEAAVLQRLAAPQAQAAPGWKLVPVEPTPEMVKAGEFRANMNHQLAPHLLARYAYSAMLKAAPAAQPAPQTDSIAVNLMRFAGLDKDKARECEQIVQTVLAAQPASQAAPIDLRAVDTARMANEALAAFEAQAAVKVCPVHDAACAEVPAAMRCSDCSSQAAPAAAEPPSPAQVREWMEALENSSEVVFIDSSKADLRDAAIASMRAFLEQQEKRHG